MRISDWYVVKFRRSRNLGLLKKSLNLHLAQDSKEILAKNLFEKPILKVAPARGFWEFSSQK